MTDRRHNVSEPYKYTCQWILDLPEYQAWTRQPHGLLWIKGKPGSGKSTVMAYLYSVISKEAYYGTKICIDFFFNARGTELQQSFIGMLRSLLNQLVTKNPQARTLVRDYYQDKCRFFGEQGHSWQWQEEELKSLLKQALSKLTRDTSVLVFVDALDEAGELAACKIVEYFHELSSSTDRDRASLKICISCRHYPVVSTGQETEVIVEQHNYSDIAAFVNYRLASTSMSPRDQDDLAVDLIQRASGVFQWIRLILPMIEKDIRDGSPLEIVRQQLRAIPDDVSNLYKHILLKVINYTNIQQSLRLFQWTCLAVTPLSNEELRYALAIDDTEAEPSYVPGSRCYDDLTLSETDEVTESRVRSLSGGLIEIFKGTVQVVHQTVQEYLMQEGLQILMTIHTAKGTQTVTKHLDSAEDSLPVAATQRSYGKLYELCLRCIATKIATFNTFMKQGWRNLEYSKSFHDELLTKPPLMRHAILYVFAYAEKAREGRTMSAIEQTERIESILQFWNAAYSILWHRSQVPYPEAENGTTVLHIAARANLHEIAAYKLRNGANIHAYDNLGYSALYVAAHWGNREVTMLLCDAGADLNQKNVFDRATALEGAAASGHLSLVEYLLQQSSDTEDSNSSKDSALFRACADGHTKVAWMLLKSGAHVNIYDSLGHTPLSSASSNGHLHTVRLLLEYGARVNVLAKRAKTALQEAASGKHMEIVRLLVKNGANVNLHNADRECALYLAVLHGNLDIARFLLANGADIDVGGPPNDPILCVALQHHPSYIELTQLLFDQKPNINQRGNYFGSPLITAAFYGHLDWVDFLIEIGADVNLQSGIFHTALQAASSQSHVHIVQTLLEAGADVNLQGGRYGSALQAASTQNLQIVQMLLDAGADVNLRGGKYGSALQAASTQNLQIVQVLLHAGADVNLQGGRYGSAFQAASRLRQPGIMQLLREAGADVNLQGGRYSSIRRGRSRDRDAPKSRGQLPLQQRDTFENAVTLAHRSRSLWAQEARKHQSSLSPVQQPRTETSNNVAKVIVRDPRVPTIINPTRIVEHAEEVDSQFE